MSNLIGILSVILSVLTFLFFLFRNLRRKIDTNIIFSIGFGILAFSVVFSLLSFLLSLQLRETVIFIPHGLTYWGGILGFFVGFYYMTRKFKFNVYRAIDASFLGAIISICILSRDILSLIIPLVILLMLKKRFKSFVPQEGTVGFLTFALYFLVRSILALFAPHMIAFTSAGKVGVVLSAAVSFLLFFSVYNINYNVRRK